MLHVRHYADPCASACVTTSADAATFSLEQVGVGKGQMSERLLYSMAEAASRLSISRSTLYELAAAGEIKTIKIGARTAVAESELRKFVASKMEAAA